MWIEEKFVLGLDANLRCVSMQCESLQTGVHVERCPDYPLLFQRGEGAFRALCVIFYSLACL